MSQNVILNRELTTPSGHVIAQLTLNSEKTLNSLSLPMVELLQQHLDAFRYRDEVVLVLLDGAGEKAFCAGGDIKRLRSDALEGDHGREFFAKEYTLDYTIHNYPKPIIVWGAGIVMGGGLGLLGGASHRVLTETSRIAMPEISIGLYPDVGGSYMLSKAPAPFGLFMGLTGCSVNAADAIELGIGDFILDSDAKNQLLANLLTVDWTKDAHKRVSQVLSQMAADCESIEPRMMSKRDDITALCSGEDLPTIIERFKHLDTDDRFLSGSKSKLLSGCPMTAHLVWQQIQRAPSMTLAEIFQMEWVMSVNCLAAPDFAEGVRALIIDKDNQPKWRHKTVNEVGVSEVEAMFTLNEPNPLAGL